MILKDIGTEMECAYFRDTIVPVRVPITVYVLPNPFCTDPVAS